MKTYFSLWAGLWLLLLAPAGLGQQKSQTPTNGKPSGATTPAAAKQAQATIVPPATQPSNLGVTDTPYIEPGYIIGAQDVLDVSVWHEQDFSRAVPVRPDGKITLPLINDVQAAGLTPVQLAGNLTKLLSKYVTDPQVTVIVAKINSRLVFLSGEIYRPGAIPLMTNMTVLQAISMAGGPNQFAKPKKIYVMRTENGEQVHYPFNYNNAIKGKGFKQNILLKPGDTIVIP